MARSKFHMAILKKYKKLYTVRHFSIRKTFLESKAVVSRSSSESCDICMVTLNIYWHLKDCIFYITYIIFDQINIMIAINDSNLGNLYSAKILNCFNHF